LDLATANTGSNIGVFFGIGNGHFAPAVNFPNGTSAGTNAITTADFNGDGNPDLAVTSQLTNSVGVLLGNGTGGFAPVVTFPSGTSGGGFVVDIATGDFNADGFPDLAAANTNGVGVLLGDGSGSFAPVVTFPGGAVASLNITPGDLNGDGLLDLAVRNSNTIGVLLNTCGDMPASFTRMLVHDKVLFKEDRGKPTVFTLVAVPNPVVNTTRIRYTVPVDAKVNIRVYDVLGREVGMVFNGQRSAGVYIQEYNTSKLSQGIYYCRMVATANGKEYLQRQKLVKAE
jgi:hypothetical protein